MMIYLPPLSVGGWGGVSCSTERGVVGGNPELLTSFFGGPSRSPFPSFCRAPVSNSSLCQRGIRLPLSSLSPDGCTLGGADGGGRQRLITAPTTHKQSFLLAVLSRLPSAAALPSSQRSWLSSLPHRLPLCLSSDPNAVGQHGTDHALIGGVVAVVVFVTLCLIIVLGRYLARHKGKSTAESHRAEGSSGARWAFPTRRARSFPRSSGRSVRLQLPIKMKNVWRLIIFHKGVTELVHVQGWLGSFS